MGKISSEFSVRIVKKADWISVGFVDRARKENEEESPLYFSFSSYGVNAIGGEQIKGYSNHAKFYEG